MSESTPNAINPVHPTQVPDSQPRRQWGKILVSSALGAAVAVVVAPTIAASAPIGAGWLVASNSAAAIVGSVTTKIAGNAIGANVTEVEYNPYRARLRFRAAIIDHFEAYLDPVINHIRSNSNGVFHQETTLALTGNLVFLRQMLQNAAGGRDESNVYLRYSYEIVRNAKSPTRPVNEGAPLPDLPVHHEDAISTLRLDEPGSVLDGITGAVVRGALFGGGIGLLGQALGQTGPFFERMFVLDTAPGMNMVFTAESASAAADPVCNLMPGASSEDRAAYLIELVAEMQLHINRVSQCAMNNGVGLIYSVHLGVSHNISADAAGASGSNRDVVWNRWEARVGV